MKKFKFGQLFSQASHAISRTTAADFEVPAPYEANCFHQLTSSRPKLGAGDSFLRRRPPLERVVAGEANFKDVCWTCKGIDFPKVLAWRYGDARPWVPLSHTLNADNRREFPNCPYCNFFRAMVGDAEGGVVDGSGKFTPYLRVRMAFEIERLGIGEKHDLAYEVLFEVMCRNRSLPEGYLVRADASDECGLAGYNAIMNDVCMRGRSVSPRLDPALPATWLEFCRANHQKTACTRFEPLVSGMRLIDCDSHRIVCVDDFDSDFLEYSALSYVWGDSPEREVFTEADGLTLLDDTPQVIGDAIYLSEVLGIKYIWVDRICLAGLDEEEKTRQIHLAGDIFAQAALTIIVASGTSVEDGIPGVSVARTAQMSLKVESDLFTTTLIRPDMEIGDSVWASRASTFQEAALSRRRLVITPSQAYFQCRATHCHESLSASLHYSTGLNLGRAFPEAGPGTEPGHLAGQIQSYIPMELADPGKRLLDFEGIIRHYAKLGVDSFVGLPLFNPADFSAGRFVSRTDRLAVALGWLPEPVRRSRTFVDPYAYRYGEHYPSWTWLAWGPRPGQPLERDFKFRFGLVDEGRSGTALNGVYAAPKMEVDVGFEDGRVLGWEVDDDEVRETTGVKFLRLRTFGFDVVITKDKEAQAVTMPDAPLLPGTSVDAIRSWFQRVYAQPSPSSPGAVAIPDGTYTLTGLLIAGRGWDSDPAGEKSATVMVCVKRDGGDDNQLVRIGTTIVPFTGFRFVEVDMAALEGVENDGGKGDVELHMREVDIY